MRWVGKREMGRKGNRRAEKDRNRDSYKVWKKQVLQEQKNNGGLPANNIYTMVSKV